MFSLTGTILIHSLITVLSKCFIKLHTSMISIFLEGTSHKAEIHSLKPFVLPTSSPLPFIYLLYLYVCFHLDFQLFEDGFYSFLYLDSVQYSRTGAHTYKKYLKKTIVTYCMENVSNKVIYCLSSANRHFYLFCSGTSLLSPATNKNNSFLSQ